MDLPILNMKQWEDMVFAQVCALVFLVACHSTGFLISQDQEPANYIAPESFQNLINQNSKILKFQNFINQKLIYKTVAEINRLLALQNL